VIYVATAIGYVSQHRLVMKMPASSFAASRLGCLTAPLATSGGAVHAEAMTEPLNGGYVEPQPETTLAQTSQKPPASGDGPP
jgi:hypothetical protein